MPSNVSIGCEVGGPEGYEISKLKIPLAQALERHVTSTHCLEIDHYALVLRIDGSLAKFGQEGLARIRLSKANRYISIDIQIPEHVWHPMSHNQFKEYLASQVLAAINACINRLDKEKLVVADSQLIYEVTAAINEFVNEECTG